MNDTEDKVDPLRRKFNALKELINSSVMSGWLTAHNFNCVNAVGRPLNDKEMKAMEQAGTQAVLLHFVNFLKDPQGQKLMEALEVEIPQEIQDELDALLEGQSETSEPIIEETDKKE